jgi:hypothetical protein
MFSNTENKKQFCSNGHDTFVVGRGKQGRCKECTRISDKIRYDRDKDKILAQKKVYGETHKVEKHAYNADYYEKHQNVLTEYQKQWRKDHPEYVEEYQSDYRQEHREDNIEYQRTRRKEHPELHKSDNIKYQTNRELRVPKWADFENIKIVIKNCPDDLTIDHIIPLQGKLVSGLHVSWNLQYLTPIENSKKKNKCNLLEASEQYSKILEEAGLK